MVATLLLIFCIIQVETPTKIGKRYGYGEFLEYSPKSIHKNSLFIGIAECTCGNQEYSFSDNSLNLSGVDIKVALNDQNKPKNIGIWTIIGPKQPKGLIPLSRYIFMISCCCLALSSYFACIIFIFGARSDIAFICRLCFNVKGNKINLIKPVKTIMLIPKLLKNIEYNKTKLFIIGLVITDSQIIPNNSIFISYMVYIYLISTMPH